MCSSNIKQIITQENGSDVYTSTRLVYASNGQVVSYIIGETCDETDPENPVYAFSFAREFRYDEPRQRYLSAELSYSGNGGWSTVSETWSDYDGDSIYGDFTVTSGTETELTSFEPGVGRVVDPLGTPSSSYYHADMLGTTRLMTDSIGIGSAHTVYTAFGEPVSGTNHRYGYAGAYGYQSHDIGSSGDAFPYQHVGHRYYNPSTGRFLQRDPIGIGGGLNVYEYVSSAPTHRVDPSGLKFWSSGGRWGLIGVCFAIGYGYTTDVIKPSLDKANDEKDKAGNPPKYEGPFNPKNPWDWADGTTWERQKRKWRKKHHPLPPKPRLPVPTCFTPFK